FTFSNNLYYATDGIAFNGAHGSGIPNETNSVYQMSPGFSDPAAGLYAIGLSSPARGRGRTLPYGSLFHYGGVSPASPPDIGAFLAQ
ncbi:MAG TPA: hypothetical protein VFV50_11320, partial [Bdellovibrionales bacterium]|nr:hypothetical protein [Bdellovibrionales bacterium]